MRLLHAYPNLMNLYGDYANLILLQKRLDGLGYRTKTETFSIGQPISLTGCDLLYFGSGTEGALLAALKDVTDHKEEFESFAAFGGAILATGNAMALFGRTVSDGKGSSVPGLGWFDFDVSIKRGRRYGEYLLSCPLTSRPVFGVLNTSLSVTGSARPLFRVEKSTEKEFDALELGSFFRNVLVTQLCGPILVRNPDLLDAYAMLLTGGRIADIHESWRHFSEASYSSVADAFSPGQRR